MTCKVNGLPKVCPNKDCRAINCWTLVQYGRFSGSRRVPGCHPCHVDGWSEIQCRNCGIRIGGWTGKVLTGSFDDGEHEAPYGGEHRGDCLYARREPVKLALVRGDVPESAQGEGR
jgi:hypothetical protein